MLRGQACIKLGEPARAAGYFEQAIITSEKPSPALFRPQVLALLASGEGAGDAAIKVVNTGLDHFGMEINLLGLGVTNLFKLRPYGLYLIRIDDERYEIPDAVVLGG